MCCFCSKEFILTLGVWERLRYFIEAFSRPGLLYNCFRKKRDCTTYVAKTKALISCAVVAALLIGAFVFAYAKSRLSHDAAQMVLQTEWLEKLVSIRNCSIDCLEMASDKTLVYFSTPMTFRSRERLIDTKISSKLSNYSNLIRGSAEDDT